MASQLLPYKALNDVNEMHYYLKQRVMNSSYVTDLIPFINILFNFEELKQQIPISLDKQHQYENSKQASSSSTDSKSKLRSLFLSLFALNGIPSDIIHANIASFLPSREYRKLPILSTHFRNIMMNNPFIFNEKGYCVNLRLCPKSAAQKRNSTISVKHINKRIDVEPTNLTKDSAKIKTSISLTTIKYWELSEYSMFTWGQQNEEQKSESAQKDNHNGFSLDLLSKCSDNIQRLDITTPDSDNILKVLQKRNYLNQLYALKLSHLEVNVPEIKLDPGSFQNLQCLEFGINTSTSINNINHILEYTSNSLKSLKLMHQNRSNGWNFGSGGKYNMHNVNQNQVLKVPANIEYISMRAVDLNLDMNQCNKLIVVNFICIDSTKIQWPKDGTRLIPFGCFGDGLTVNEWKDIILNKDLNVKFVLLKKVKAVNTDNFNWGGSGQKLQFNDCEAIKQRIYIDDYIGKHEDENKCLVLRKEDMNQELLDKVIKYEIKDDNLRDRKYRLFAKLRELRCLKWILDLDE